MTLPTDETVIRKAIGAAMRRRRDLLGLSVNAASTRYVERTGAPLARQSLDAYEKGDRAVTVPTLYRLATAYDCPVRDLLPDLGGDEGGAFQDVTVRVRTTANMDGAGLEAALVAAAERLSDGARVVATSAPFLPAEGS